MMLAHPSLARPSLAGDLLRALGDSPLERSSLALEALETDEAYWVRAALPGFSRDQIQIDLQHDRLILRAEKPVEAAEPGSARRVLGRPLAREASAQLSFPREIDPSGAKARLDLGVLEIQIPKRLPASSRVQID